MREDGTPGDFGYLWNTGDYYFQGKKLTQSEINELVYYYERTGQQAPSLEAAIKFHKEASMGIL